MSLLVGFHIKSALLKDEALVKEVGSRIYPLVIPEGAPEYPFIVYGSAGNISDGHKGWKL